MSPRPCSAAFDLWALCAAPIPMLTEYSGVCWKHKDNERRVLSRKAVELLFKEDVACQDAMGWHFDDSKWWCVGRLCRQAHLQEQKEGAAASLINCAA